MRPSRRQVLSGVAAGLAGALLPRRARASVSGSDRRLLIVQTLGGWDVTRVFAPLFGSEAVSMESLAVETQVGNIPIVDHPERPSVLSFFQTWGAQTAVVNGVYVPSISHHSATRLMLTGVVDAAYPDWGSRVAAAHAEEHIVPYLVAGGANFAGPYGVHIGRAGTSGQLPGLATGELVQTSDTSVTLPSAGAQSLVDRYLADAAARRKAARDTVARQSALESYEIALDRASRLKALADSVDLSTDTSFSGQSELAIRAFTNDLSRCVSIAYPMSDSAVEWDTHANNDADQNVLFEGLFADLSTLLDMLATAPGMVGETLLDETTVVVLSEMGRTPFQNGSGGKDHWPYTSALFVGAGVAGDRVVGGFDEGQYGQRVSPSSGEVDEGGTAIGNDVIGATILALCDLDPKDQDVDAEILEAVIA